jgi:hypothetical protein
MRDKCHKSSHGKSQKNPQVIYFFRWGFLKRWIPRIQDFNQAGEKMRPQSPEKNIAFWQEQKKQRPKCET